MKTKFISVIKYVTTFFVLMLVFNILLYLVCSFDSKTIRTNVEESSSFISEQGMHHKLSNIFEIWNDNCTEAVMLNEAYSIDYKNPFVSYMKAMKNYDPSTNLGEYDENIGEGVTVNYNYETQEEIYSGNYNSVTELSEFLNGNIHYSVPYGRYWHGYLVLIRPLLIMFNIHQIKVLQIIVFSLLFVLLEYMLYKRFGKNIMIIFGASLICSGYFSAAYSVACGLTFITMMIASIILLKRIDKIKNPGLYFFIVGCITNYVDYLRVPLITLGVPLAIILLKKIEEDEDWKSCLKSLIFYSFTWVLGYAGSWIFKWAFYDLTINDNNNMLNIGFTQSFYRMNRTNATAGDANIFNRIISIFGPRALYTTMVAMLLLFVNKIKISVSKVNKNIILYWILSLYPIIWCLVLANHTLLHSYFTYRQTLIFMLGTLLCFNALLFKNGKEKKPSKKNK